MEHREAKHPTQGPLVAKRTDTVQTVSRNTQMDNYHILMPAEVDDDNMIPHNEDLIHKDNYHILMPADLDGENDDVIPRNDELMHEDNYHILMPAEVDGENDDNMIPRNEDLIHKGKKTNKSICFGVAVVVAFGAGVGLLLFFLLKGSSLDGHSDGFQNITGQALNYPSTNSNELSKIIEQMDSRSPRIDLSGKNITEILPDAFINMKNLRTVFLRDNRELVIAPDKVWIYHPSIMHIDLSDNNLGPLNPVVFEGLPSLKSVNLAGNDGGCETREIVLLSNATYEIQC